MDGAHRDRSLRGFFQGLQGERNEFLGRYAFGTSNCRPDVGYIGSKNIAVER